MRQLWIGSACLLASLLGACAGSPDAGDAAAAVRDVSREELVQMLEQERVGLLLDVRTPEEFAQGHVAGAVNISHDRIAERMEEIAAFEDQSVVLYCRSGRRAGIAASVLREAGFEDLAHLDGDMLGWLEAGLPVER